MLRISKSMIGACAIVLSSNLPLRAETTYLFVGDRSTNPARANSIHRFSFDSENPSVLTPAPSAGQTDAIWGSSVGKPYQGMRFTDMVIAPNGDLYVACRDTNNVIRFDGQTGADKGEVVKGLNNPDGITIGPDGNLYVTSNESVARFKLDGTPLPGDGQVGSIFAIGGRLTAASGLAFGPDGNLYVASQGSHQVLRFNGQTGEFLGVFCNENVMSPSEIAFGPDGNLYVASTGGPGFNAESGYVAKYDGVTGKFIGKVAPEVKGALGLTFGIKGDLFVSGYWNGQITRIDAKTGQSLGVVANPPTGGSFYYFALAKPGTGATPRLQSVDVKFPMRPPTVMKTNPNTRGADTVKGWKSALAPKGTPGPLLNLASGKKTDYAILLPANASTMDQKAAALLASNLRQITGAQFAIVNEGSGAKAPGKVISIGHTELLKKSGLKEATLDLGREGYAIAAKGNTLFLVGGRMRGAIYAVDTLLEEDLGVRWYASDGIARIPRRENLSFKPSLRHFVPVLEVRDPYYQDAFDTDWSLKNKTNSPAAPVPLDWGGYASSGSYFVHTYNAFVPPDKYFKEHPEYFAEIDGKRTPTQLDLSNPDVLRIVTQHVREALKADPKMKIISVSPNDGRGYCECPICSALDKAEATVPNSKSGSLINFVNKVAAAIEPEFPDVRVSTLAYLDTFMPPKTIRPHKNVAIQLCTDSHAWRYQFCFTTESPKFQSAMKAWDAIGADIHIWDYTTSFVHYMVPMPNMPVVTDNMKFYLAHGAKGIMLQGNYSTMGGENSPMRSWVWAKQLWDPTRDTRALMRDFIFGYHGEAAEPMWQYNMMLWQMWEDNHKIPHEMYLLNDKKPEGPNPLLINDSPCSAPPDYPMMTKEYIDKSTKLFEQAEALAKDPQTLQRVRVAKLPLLYVKLGQGLGYYGEFGDYKPGSWVKDGDPVQKVYYEKLYNEFMDISKSINVTNAGELTPMGKVTTKWREMLDRNWTDIPSVKLNAQWKFKPDAENAGITQTWFAPGTDDAAWSNISTEQGKGWESQGFKDHTGTSWYRQTLTLPENFDKSKHLYLYFGAVDSESEIYINGQKAFEHTLASTGLKLETIWNAPFAFDAKPFLKANEPNTIAVRVSSSGGVRGIWKNVYLFATDDELDMAKLGNSLYSVG